MTLYLDTFFKNNHLIYNTPITFANTSEDHTEPPLSLISFNRFLSFWISHEGWKLARTRHKKTCSGREFASFDLCTLIISRWTEYISRYEFYHILFLIFYTLFKLYLFQLMTGLCSNKLHINDLHNVIKHQFTMITAKINHKEIFKKKDQRQVQ